MEEQMNSVKKIIEKEQQKSKKNPGKANKQKRKEINKAKRGEPIPIAKVVTPKKAKENKRTNLKKKLKKEIEEAL